MGIIQKQSIRSTIGITAGFAIGAFNVLVLAPKLLSTDEFGLTRLITDIGITLATFCTVGTLPVIYKFFPFYRGYLGRRQNDLPAITITICALAFLLVLVASRTEFLKQLIFQKFNTKSPLFVKYSYLVYPFSLFYLLFIWLESFGWSFKKGISTNLLRELAPRLIFTLLLILLATRVITLNSFLWLFALSYLVSSFWLFFVLRTTGEFNFTFSASNVTNRLKSKMASFALFVFGAQALNLISKTADTIIISSRSNNGLADAAVFTVAAYVVSLMEIPQRSINAISIPVLAESWKEKNLTRIKNIYQKSVSNLLVIGLAMFCLLLLNIHNLSIYLGKDYRGIEIVVFFLGISKLVDLGTGANTQIIGTSNFWKVDFITNVIYTLVALPLNYFLIGRYGLQGAAYATLIAICFYNALRFAFLWYKFGLQPYTWKDGLALMYAAMALVLCYQIPYSKNIFADTAIRTLAFSIIFLPAVYYTGVSIEVNELIRKYFAITKKAIGFK